MRLFLDMDGVLADFDRRATEILGMHPVEYERLHGLNSIWQRMYETEDFFYSFDPMPDAFDLLDGTAHLSPTVLTGVPRGGWAEEQKRRWIRDRLTGYGDLPVITCFSRNKRDHCEPGDILIDDRAQYRHLWEEAGGTFILHTSAADSLAKLANRLSPNPHDSGGQS